VRRSPCRFNLEHLEDRLTPSGQGLLGAAAPIQTGTLFVDWSSRVNVTVLNFSNSFPLSEVVQIDFRIELPVFSVFEYQGQSSAFGPSSTAFGSQTTGAFGTSSPGDFSLGMASINSTAASPGASSQAASAARQPSVNPPSRTPIVMMPPAAPVQNSTNPAAATVQTGQAANANINFVAVSQLRAATPTASGASDAAASEALRVFPLQIDLGAPSVNPRAVTNPIATPLPKLTPLPPSGGGDTAQPDDKVMPPAVERAPGEQQESQELQELAGAGLSAAFVPDNVNDAAAALALVGDFDAPSASSEVQLLLLGVIAASAIGVAHRRNRTEQSERELLEAANWLARPVLK